MYKRKYVQCRCIAWVCCGIKSTLVMSDNRLRKQMLMSAVYLPKCRCSSSSLDQNQIESPLAGRGRIDPRSYCEKQSLPETPLTFALLSPSPLAVYK